MDRKELLALLHHAQEVGWTAPSVDLSALERRLVTEADEPDETLASDVSSFTTAFLASPQGRKYQRLTGFDVAKALARQTGRHAETSAAPSEVPGQSGVAPCRSLGCIDEGIRGRAVGLGGSGILVAHHLGKEKGLTGWEAVLAGVDEVARLLRGKIQEVTSHEGCAAAQIVFNELSESEKAKFSNADDMEDRFAVLLAKKLGLPHRNITAEKMARPLSHHNARKIFYTGTPYFFPDSFLSEGETAYVISRGILNGLESLQTARHLGLLHLEAVCRIALTQSLPGMEFTPENPFLIIPIGGDLADLATLRAEAETIATQFVGRVKVFEAPGAGLDPSILRLTDVHSGQASLRAGTGQVAAAAPPDTAAPRPAAEPVEGRALSPSLTQEEAFPFRIKFLKPDREDFTIVPSDPPETGLEGYRSAEIQEALHQLDAGARVITVSGEVGQGKSTFFGEGLQRILESRGKRVYYETLLFGRTSPGKSLTEEPDVIFLDEASSIDHLEKLADLLKDRLSKGKQLILLGGLGKPPATQKEELQAFARDRLQVAAGNIGSVDIHVKPLNRRQAAEILFGENQLGSATEREIYLDFVLTRLPALPRLLQYVRLPDDVGGLGDALNKFAGAFAALFGDFGSVQDLNHLWVVDEGTVGRIIDRTDEDIQETLRQAPLRGKRVLVIDDQEVIVKLVAQHLESHDMVVTTTTDPEEALRLLLTGEYDLLVTDLMMPKLDGVTLLNRLITAGRFVPTLVLSGSQGNRAAAHLHHDLANEAFRRAGLPILYMKKLEENFAAELIGRLGELAGKPRFQSAGVEEEALPLFRAVIAQESGARGGVASLADPFARLSQSVERLKQGRDFTADIDTDQPVEIIIPNMMMEDLPETLVTNAIQATPAGSPPPVFRARLVDAEAIFSAMEVGPQGNDPVANPHRPSTDSISAVSKKYIYIGVVNHGPAVSDKNRQKMLLAKSFTTKDFGTGLGLPLVHEYLREVGGWLEVQSRDGKTEVGVFIPVEPNLPRQTGTQGSPSPGGNPEPASGVESGPDHVPAPMRVPGEGGAEVLLVERATTRPISPLELAAFGEIVRLRPATAVLPKDKTQLIAIYASMAEYMLERGLVKAALQLLDGARSTLPETVPHREVLLTEWKAKRARWKRWSDQIAAGEALFKETEEKERSRKRSKSARRYAGAAQILAAVAMEADREGLPFLVHQIMHVHHLEAALEGALGLGQGAGFEEMQRLHRKSHEEIFWSPVGYDSVPNNVVAPEGAQIREQILLAQKLCGFRWGHDDDVRLLAETETIQIGRKRDEERMSRIYAMKKIAEEVGECRTALGQLVGDPRRVVEAQKHLDAAQLLMTSFFGKGPPDFLKTLVSEMALYLGRQAGGTGGQKGGGSGGGQIANTPIAAIKPPAPQSVTPMVEPTVEFERADEFGYRFRKEADSLLVRQAKGEVPTDDLLVVVFPSPELAPLDTISTHLKNRYIQTLSDASEAGLASLVLTGPAGDGRFLTPFATAMVASRMGEFAPQARTNRATFAGGSFREGINRAVRSFALTAFSRGEKVFTARLVADAIWTYEGYLTHVDGKDETHAKQITLSHLLKNLHGEEEVIAMIKRWLDWPIEDWLSLNARVVLVWNGKEYEIRKGDGRRLLRMEIVDSVPFGKDPKARAMDRMRRVLTAPVTQATLTLTLPHTPSRQGRGDLVARTAPVRLVSSAPPMFRGAVTLVGGKPEEKEMDAVPPKHQKPRVGGARHPFGSALFRSLGQRVPFGATNPATSFRLPVGR